MIKKESDGYHIYSEKGKHLGGPYSKSKAEKRLQQIEMFKHMKESKMESNIDKCLFVIAEAVPNTTGIRDALDKVITGDGELSDRERLTLLKYKLIGDNGKPTKLAREEFSELFD